MTDFSQIFKATYSGVPVYEMNCKGIAVMRRRSDSYLNATQILKVADFDKPQRTRILEREVQTGQHEKVQGGYGKYQGTWVPFERGKILAELYEVDTVLAPILQFVKGDESPPLAPKHVSTAVARPRKSREVRARKKIKHFDDEPTDEVILPKSVKTIETIQEETSTPIIPSKRVRTPKSTIKEKLNHQKHQNTKSSTLETVDKKTNIPKEIEQSKDHLIKKESVETEGVDKDETMDYEFNEKSYAHKLLQYFMSNKTNIPSILNKPPRDMDLDVIIDDEGHNSLHWAAAMARIKIVKLLIENGADIYRVNYKGQTALMRSVLFSNNFDLKTFDSLLDLLGSTIFNIDKKDQTVFHHTAAMSDWKGKIYASRYYMECLINKLKNNQSELISILNVQDVNGNTALTIAAKIGNRRLIKLLIDAGASTEIANEDGLTPKYYFNDIDKLTHTRHSVSSPPLTITSPSSDTVNSNLNEADLRESLKAKVEAMFQDVENDHNNAQPISEAFDEFAESYERDLSHKERLLEKKKIELNLSIRRLDETKKILNSIFINDEEELVNGFIENVNQQATQAEKSYQKWLKYSQKLNLEILQNQFYQENEKKPPSPPHHHSIDQLKDTAKKLLDELKQLESSRERKVEKLIKLQCSIPPKKYQDYKRLISTSCNVAYENVDMMLGPLLASFEVEDLQDIES